jgi:Tfp pilus assembly protein PilF
VSLLRVVVAASPELVPAHHNLGVALIRIDQPDEAMEQFQWIVTNVDSAPGAYLSMAGIEAKRGRTTEARRYIAQAISQGGDGARERALADPDLRELVK